MATNGIKSSPLSPESLPPKKRNVSGNSNEVSAEPVFKMPSPFWNQNGNRRTRRTQEPAAVSVVDFHPAAMYYPLWTHMSPALQHPSWDNSIFPVWAQHFPSSEHPLGSSSNWNNQMRAHEFYGSPMDELVKSSERIPGQYGPKIVKPVPRSLASYYTRGALHKEPFRGEEIRGQFEGGTATVAQWDERLQNKRTQNDWRTRKRNCLRDRIKQDSGKIADTQFLQHTSQSEFKDISQATDISKADLQHQKFAAIQPSFSTSEALNPQAEATVRNHHLLAGSGSAESQEQQKPASHLFSRFAEGSLIELAGGQLKRVEDLKMEDFECCTESCPELKLKRFTVQKITNSHIPGLVCLEVQVEDDLKSKISLEVCEEYPFFVCDRGWSSCSPARTASYLRCHQLQLGDTCLALTPVPVPPTKAGACEGNGGHRVNVINTEKAAEGRKMRRHRSAPELRNVE